MSFFSRTNKSSINWHNLSALSELDDIITESMEKPVVIFKHSTRCSISTMVKSRLENSWNYNDDELPIYYLDLLRYRNISDKISSEFKIEHASPQVLLIIKGEVVYHTSHNGISSDDFKAYL